MDLIGAPLVIKAQRLGAPSRPGTRHEDGRGQRRFPGWYNDVRLPGHLIVENAIHNLDGCDWLAGCRPASSCGHGKRWLPKPMSAGTVMMDGFSEEYVYENSMHLEYSQLYPHTRALQELPTRMWFVVYGEKGSISLDYSPWTFYAISGDGDPVDHHGPQGANLTVSAHDDFVRAVRESRETVADIKVAATAAHTSIMGREAVYQRRMVTWDEMDVTVKHSAKGGSFHCSSPPRVPSELIAAYPEQLNALHSESSLNPDPTTPSLSACESRTDHFELHEPGGESRLPSLHVCSLSRNETEPARTGIAGQGPPLPFANPRVGCPRVCESSAQAQTAGRCG